MEAWENFRHCPKCGQPSPGEAANPFRCGSCGFAYWFNTASAVAVFIEDDQGRCLFIRRAREPSMGKLAVPGGFTDPAETGEEASRREIREEVGIELGPFAYLGAWPNRYAAGGFIVPVLDIYYSALAITTGHTLAHDEVTSAIWLDPLTVDPAELAFQSLREALKEYLHRIGGDTTERGFFNPPG